MKGDAQQGIRGMGDMEGGIVVGAVLAEGGSGWVNQSRHSGSQRDCGRRASSLPSKTASSS